MLCISVGVLCILGNIYTITTSHFELTISRWSGWQWFFMPMEGRAGGSIHCKILASKLFIE